MYPEYQKYLPPKRGRRQMRSLKPTGKDILGPFYREGAPYKTSIYGEYNEAEVLTIQGKVTDTEGVSLSHAVLDVWQANEHGVYDNQRWDFRGKVIVGGSGHPLRYRFRTVKPGEYDISEKEDPQPHVFRCSHIHVILKAVGCKTLVTQLYFKDSKFNDTDEWYEKFGGKDRIISFDGVVGTFDFVLERE